MRAPFTFGDLKFSLRFGETWLLIAIGLIIGGLIGYLA